MKLNQIASNLTRLQIGKISIWFSYETPVAVQEDDLILVSENVWSRTTGKHINQIKSSTLRWLQLPNKEFEHKLQSLERIWFHAGETFNR